MSAFFLHPDGRLFWAVLLVGMYVVIAVWFYRQSCKPLTERDRRLSAVDDELSRHHAHPVKRALDETGSEAERIWRDGWAA